ncbi:solute carrier family 30 (zinc transporter), member 2 [Pancytospora philotis]|nr:solute carrier family 30 (zinc transporter), member 2 [Pancytospora philotis]
MKMHMGCSSHTGAHGSDISRIVKVSLLISVFMVLELWGHYRTRSLSLLADALHLLVDISGFVASIATLKLAERKQSKSMTWGYQRVEILGAMLSVILIWIAVGYLMVESLHKYLHPQEIDGSVFLVVAVAGLAVNLVSLYILHSGERSASGQQRSLNLRATYAHVLGDVAQSVGVIVASSIIYFRPAFVLADPICTVIFALTALASTFHVVRDGLYILADGAPRGVDQEGIRQFVLAEPVVISIVDMKIWSLSTDKHAILLTVLADNLLMREYEGLLHKLRTFLREQHRFDTVSIQIETPQTSGDSATFEPGSAAFPALPVAA